MKKGFILYSFAIRQYLGFGFWVDDASDARIFDTAEEIEKRLKQENFAGDDAIRFLYHGLYEIKTIYHQPKTTPIHGEHTHSY